MKIRKAGEGTKLHLFKEIPSEIIFSGEKMMFFRVDLKPGQLIPTHTHPHEQMGLCLKGHAEFVAGEDTVSVKAGTFYWIAQCEPHSVRALEDSSFLDVFSPPRVDYLEKAGLSRNT